MKSPRAPRSKKRIACELTIGGDRYKGFALDISATGLFVQTNLKPAAGAAVEVQLTMPGSEECLVVQARVARANVVPVQLLAAAKGGVGLSLVDPPKAYLDFLAALSPEQAEFVAGISVGRPGTGSGAARAGSTRAGGGAAAGSAPAKRFRVHAVYTATGKKSSYIVTGENEEKARAHVLAELGSAWLVLFVERV